MNVHEFVYKNDDWSEKGKMPFRQVITYSTVESITDYETVAIPPRNVVEREEGQDAIPSSRNIF